MEEGQGGRAAPGLTELAQPHCPYKEAGGLRARGALRERSGPGLGRGRPQVVPSSAKGSTTTGRPAHLPGLSPRTVFWRLLLLPHRPAGSLRGAAGGWGAWRWLVGVG